jgi:hypothetical protein
MTTQHSFEKFEVGLEFASLAALHMKDAKKTLSGAEPFFLNPEYFTDAATFCGFKEDIYPCLEKTANDILKNKELVELVRLCCYVLFYTDEEIKDWPEPDKFQLSNGGVFYLLVALAMVDKVKDVHRRMSIPGEITRATCREIYGFCGNYIHARGVPGIFPKQLSWFRNYTKGELFRLGRMEYRIKPLKQACCRVFRHKADRTKLVLAEHENKYDSEGLFHSPDSPNTRGVWTAIIEYGENAVTGFPISPEGRACRRKMTLSLSEWEEVLKPGDPVIEMHIPPGGGMSPEKCLDSLKRAFAFFREKNPGMNLPAVCCQASWIFNTQLEKALPESNLAGFMRQLYLYPVASTGKDGLWFVFCEDYEDWNEAPRDTSLQRAMLDIVCSGRKLRSAGMFIFSEELDSYGKAPYRTKWAEMSG